MQTFKVSDEILMGDNLIATSIDLFNRYGHKALLVTGPHVGKSQMASLVEQALKRDNVACVKFDGVTGEPTTSMVDEGLKLYRDHGCDMIVGLGGGSPLDTAKAIAAMVANPGQIADYVGKEIGGQVPPVIAIPTTAGTGSEATKFTIITNPETGVKMFLKGEALLPRVVLIDYGFGMDAPRKVTAATAIDALTHSIEAYISKKQHPLTDPLCLMAIKKITKYLPMAYADGSDARARKELAIAALMGGIAINNSSVTVVHGMSRPIGALFHVPHGVSNAMLLPACLRDLEEEHYRRLGKIGKYLHLEAFDGRDSAHKFILLVELLIRNCGIHTLKEYGIDQERYFASIDKMSHDALASGSPQNAPKDYTAQDLQQLYRKAWDYEKLRDRTKESTLSKSVETLKESADKVKKFFGNSGGGDKQ